MRTIERISNYLNSYWFYYHRGAKLPYKYNYKSPNDRTYFSYNLYWSDIYFEPEGRNNIITLLVHRKVFKASSSREVSELKLAEIFIKYNAIHHTYHWIVVSIKGL